jgi:hypothetical protein
VDSKLLGEFHSFICSLSIVCVRRIKLEEMRKFEKSSKSLKKNSQDVTFLDDFSNF